MRVCLVGGFLRPANTGLWTYFHRLATEPVCEDLSVVRESDLSKWARTAVPPASAFEDYTR